MEKELLTNSRVSAFLNCPRGHYYRYELGLRPVEDSDALRFGSAFHLVRQKRAEGVPMSELIPTENDIETETDAKLWALSLAYERRWNAEADEIESMKPEIEFGPDPVCGSRTFYRAGKIDGLAKLKDGRLALVEHKTTSEDISDGADYWLRLSFNSQLYTYWQALLDRGIRPDTVIYDVIRKPTIKQGAKETAQEYAERLLDDATGESVQATDKSGNPAFTPAGNPKWKIHGAAYYFQRRHVAITQANLDEFRAQTRGVCHALVYYKAEARACADPAQAWPRNCNPMICDFCGYRSICHGRVTVNPECPPAGFKIVPPNEEISVALPGPENDGMK